MSKYDALKRIDLGAASLTALLDASEPSWPFPDHVLATLACLHSRIDYVFEARGYLPNRPRREEPVPRTDTVRASSPEVEEMEVEEVFPESKKPLPVSMQSPKTEPRHSFPAPHPPENSAPRNAVPAVSDTLDRSYGAPEYPAPDSSQLSEWPGRWELMVAPPPGSLPHISASGHYYPGVLPAYPTAAHIPMRPQSPRAHPTAPAVKKSASPAPQNAPHFSVFSSTGEQMPFASHPLPSASRRRQSASASDPRRSASVSRYSPFTPVPVPHREKVYKPRGNIIPTGNQDPTRSHVICEWDGCTHSILRTGTEQDDIKAHWNDVHAPQLRAFMEEHKIDKPIRKTGELKPHVPCGWKGCASIVLASSRTTFDNHIKRVHMPTATFKCGFNGCVFESLSLANLITHKRNVHKVRAEGGRDRYRNQQGTGTADGDSGGSAGEEGDAEGRGISEGRGI